MQRRGIGFKSISQKVWMAVVCALLCFAFLFTSVPVFSSSAASSTDSKTTYYPDFPDLESELESAAELNKELAGEGMVLLKNQGDALPLSSSERNITLFGKGSTDTVYGGSGSGSGSGDYVTLQAALEEAGFSVNPLVATLYANTPQLTATNSSGTTFFRESDPDEVLATAAGSYLFYNDAAIVVLTRSGGEGSDLPTYNVEGHDDPYEHYLELDDNEQETIALAKQNFDKVIILVNSSNALELGSLKSDPEIDAILWMGAPGTNGTLAVGEILNGTLNPSGKTVDIFPTDFTKDPTWYNSTDNGQTHFTGLSNGVATFDTTVGGAYVTDYTTARLDDGSVPTFNSHEFYSLTYKEGIYLGYRYYETVADMMDAAAAGTGETWYQSAVAYPFGYGLSYTDFTMTMSELTDNADAQTISFTVTVTNTGNVAGKQVVQIYSNPPYTDGEIEKATANFINFEKTDLLEPGDSQTLSFTITYEELASFDDSNDNNNNDHTGYELDAGTYVISANSDSHTIAASRTWTIEQDINFDDSDPLFSNGDEFSTTRDASLELKGTETELTGEDMDELTRASGTAFSLLTDGKATDVSVLKTTVADDLTFSEEFIDYLIDEEDYYAYEDDPSDPWYKTSADITGWSQAGQRPDGLSKTTIQLWDMSGEELGNDKWVQFMNQLTYYEMVELLSEGHQYSPANDRIGKPEFYDYDGPAQLKGNLANGYFWCSATLISCTYNKELAYLQGIHVGNESILTDTNGWYGPSMNIHRSPFSGRNFEYYSQDGKQGGLMAAQVVKGAREKGTHTYIKHFALNDQETHRHGIMTWVNEQAAREIYFRNFELAVTIGGSNGTMTSFNRIGLNPASNNAVYNELLVGEWGFDGLSVTDGNGPGSTAYGWNGNNDARATVFPLSYGYNGITTPEVATGANMEGYYDTKTNMLYIPNETQAKAGTNALDANGNLVWTTQGITQWYWVRTSAMRLLYVIANSNAMDNGIDVSSFADTTVNMTQGVSYSKDLAASLSGSLFSFELTSGSLPAGVTLSADGVLSGIPTDSGTYTAAITVTVDNYITQTATFTFAVGNLFTAEVNGTEIAGDSITLAKGTSYQDAICWSVTDADILAMGFNEAGGDTIAYSVTSANLPAGMDSEATVDGIELFGTPSESGTFDITVRIAWTDQDYSFRGASTLYYSKTYTVIVPEITRTVTVDYNCTDLSNSTVSVADGSTFSLIDPTRVGYVFTGWYADAGCAVAFDFSAAVTADTTVYAGWTQLGGGSSSGYTDEDIAGLIDRIEALEGEAEGEPVEEEGGCGSLVAGSSAIAAGAVLCAAAVCAVVVSKKRSR